MMKYSIIFFLISIISLVNCKVELAKSKLTKEPTYQVIKVADGDTATLKNNSDNKLVRVRFLCIDAPEKSQGKWGELSLAKLAELLPLKSEVTLIGSKTDLYGRTVSEVVNEKGVNINKKMTELGLVVYYPFQKGCEAYKEIEAKAKKAKVGVWNDAKFEMPWDYRTRMGIGARGKGFTKSASATTSSTKEHHTRHSRTTTTTKKI